MCSDRLRHVRVVLPAPLDTYINTDQLSPPPRSICKAAGRGLRGGAASAARGVRCMKHVVYHAALISHILQLMCIHAHGMPRYRRVALGESWHELVAKVFRVLTGPHWRLRVHGGPGPSDGAGACWHGEVVEIAKPLMTDQISELRARAAARLSLLAVHAPVGPMTWCATTSLNSLADSGLFCGVQLRRGHGGVGRRQRQHGRGQDRRVRAARAGGEQTALCTPSRQRLSLLLAAARASCARRDMLHHHVALLSVRQANNMLLAVYTLRHPLRCRWRTSLTPARR